MSVRRGGRFNALVRRRAQREAAHERDGLPMCCPPADAKNLVHVVRPLIAVQV